MAAPKRAPGADEENTRRPAKDARAEALRALQDQSDARREASNPEPTYEGEPVEAGGGVKVGVVFDHYQLRVSGVWRSFQKGDVLAVAEDVAARGEALGGLVRL